MDLAQRTLDLERPVAGCAAWAMTRGDGGALPLVRTPGNARQRRAWLCTSAQREVRAWPRHVAMSEATLSGPLVRCASGDEQPQAMRHAARS